MSLAFELLHNPVAPEVKLLHRSGLCQCRSDPCNTVDFISFASVDPQALFEIEMTVAEAYLNLGNALVTNMVRCEAML